MDDRRHEKRLEKDVSQPQIRSGFNCTVHWEYSFSAQIYLCHDIVIQNQ